MPECKTYCGNGEIITDWDIYLSPPEDEINEFDGTEECPDCDGYGYIDELETQ